MPIVADTHVHIYGCYNLADFFRSAWDNLGRLASAARTEGAPVPQPAGALSRILCLAERSDAHYFKGLKEGDPDLQPHGYRVQATPEEAALVVERERGERLLLVAGRQVVTRERLEVLALTADLECPDGLPLREALETVRQAGGIPVLAWSPGKWFFGRGRVVREWVSGADPDAFLLGDTTLRPTVWPEPRLMRAARRRGFGVVAGSDPLPFPGEERSVGRYGVYHDADLDAEKPVSALRRLLRERPPAFRIRGTRSSPADFVKRWKQNQGQRA